MKHKNKDNKMKIKLYKNQKKKINIFINKIMNNNI